MHLSKLQWCFILFEPSEGVLRFFSSTPDHRLIIGKRFVSRSRKHSAERPPEMGGWVLLSGGPVKTDPVSLFCFRPPLERGA